MSVMLPDQLIWVMDMLGYSWPDINEDDIKEIGRLTRQLSTDLEEVIQHADEKITEALPSAGKSKWVQNYVAAWQTNRSQNLEQMIAVLQPIPEGCDIAGDIVVGLKFKCIAHMTWDLGTTLFVLSNPITAPTFPVKKKASQVIMNILVDKAAGHAIEFVAPVIIEPLAEHLPGVLEAAFGAPELEDSGTTLLMELFLDPEEIAAVKDTMAECESEMQRIITTYVGDVADLSIAS